MSRTTLIRGCAAPDRQPHRPRDFRCSPVQECLELFGHRRPAIGGRNLLWRNGSDPDLLVGVDQPALELLESGFHTLWQLAGPLNSRHCARREFPTPDHIKLSRKEADSSVGNGTGVRGLARADGRSRAAIILPPLPSQAVGALMRVYEAGGGKKGK